MGVSVLIVDDHAGFRRHARRLLECEGYRVGGEAADCVSALDPTREIGPELVLVDVHLPDADGFELANRIRALPDPPAVVLTSSRYGAELVPKSELSREAIESCSDERP